MNQHQSVVEMYASLCAKFRKHTKDMGVCANCSRPYDDHSGSRCNICTTSTTFQAVDADERRKVRESLELVEKLAEINGWEF